MAGEHVEIVPRRKMVKLESLDPAERKKQGRLRAGDREQLQHQDRSASSPGSDKSRSEHTRRARKGTTWSSCLRVTEWYRSGPAKSRSSCETRHHRASDDTETSQRTNSRRISIGRLRSVEDEEDDMALRRSEVDGWMGSYGRGGGEDGRRTSTSSSPCYPSFWPSVHDRPYVHPTLPAARHANVSYHSVVPSSSSQVLCAHL